MHRTAKVAIATLISCAVVIGCGRGAVSSTDFSDRQIFEGVMFGAGPVANLLPEARDQLRPELYVQDTGALATMAEARANVIDAVENAHPGFLAAFASAARSGDPAQVRAMVDGGASAIVEAWDGAGRPVSKGDQFFNVPVNGLGRPVSKKGDQFFNVPVNGPGRTVSKKGDQFFNVPVNGFGRTISKKGDQFFNVPVNGPGRALEIRDLHPAWDLFSGSLFTEQLASSVAMTFGQPASER